MSSITPEYRKFIDEQLNLLKTKKLEGKVIPTVPRKFYTLYYVLRNAPDIIPLNGEWLEFGVWKGVSINIISKHTKKTVYGFDSFEGLPNNGNGEWKDNFDVKGKFPEVNSNVKLIKGWFNETIQTFKKDVLGDKPIAFLHIDCDIYSSTKTIFNMLKSNIVPGTVIVFDELLHYVGFENHELKAFYEFVTENNIKFEWIGIKNKVLGFNDYLIKKNKQLKTFKHFRNIGCEQEVAVKIIG